MEIYTIGFTQKTAEDFFEALRRAGIRRVVDTRINNVSQLAGFTKKADLQYFLKEICGAAYSHELRLAPTKELLKEYRDGKIQWSEYEERFNHLMRSRQVEMVIPKSLFGEKVALLCSEATPEHCHRRLVVEYLNQRWGDVTAIHL